MKNKFTLIPPPNRQNWFRRPFLTASLLAALAVPGQIVQAADVVWDGGIGNTNTAWLGAANWNPDGVPGGSDNAIFNGSGLTNVAIIDTAAVGGTQYVGSVSLIPGQGGNITIRNTSVGATGMLVLNGVGGILLSNSTATGGEMIVGSSSSGTSLGLGLAASGAIYSSSTLVASTPAGRVEIYSVMSDVGGSRGITLTGPGNVYLRGANTYSGDTIILDGALELDTVGQPGNGAGTIYLSGGNIQSGASRNGYNTGTFIANPIFLTADARIFNTGSTANSTRYIPFSGSLGGNAGTLIICNPTTVSGNSFVPRFSGSFTFNRPVVIGDTSGGAFDDNLLSFSVVDMCNAATNGAQTWTGTISGPGSIRRRSPILNDSVPGGTAILTGNNTYSGGTTINSGSMFANNPAGSALGSGAVTVTGLGTLAGNGAVLAPVSVSGGGTVQPGATSTSVGNLTVDSLTVGPGANYAWQITAATGTPGTAWDLITCNSGWTDAGSSSNKNVIYLKSSGVPTGWNNAMPYTWLILSNTVAGAPGFDASNWALDTTDFYGVAAGSFSLSTDGNGSLNLVYTPLPNSVPVARMLILTPGESATFGSAPGKTGSPSARQSTVPYSVTVHAVDANYNLCSNSIDTVVVVSSSGGDTLPAKKPLVNGTMTFQVANNTVGSTTLTATNVTQGLAVTTGSSTVSVSINNSTTTLASSVNPAAEGVPVTFTATVSSGAAVRTGTVTFVKNATVVLGTSPLFGNAAVLTLSGGTGTNSIIATYNGDPDNTGSTSGALLQVVQPGGGGLAVVGAAALMEDGQDYPLAGSTPIAGRGPWVAGGGTGSTSFIKILADDLSLATSPGIRPLTNTVNPAAKLQIAKAGTSSRWYYRSLSNNVASGSVYFSFLLNVTVNPTTTDEFMGSMLAGGGNTTPAPTDPLTLHARAGSDATHFNLGIQRLNGDPVWTGELEINVTNLVVLKYTFGPSATCSLFVNPTPGGTEPAPTISATSDGVTPEPANIGTVLFYEAGSAVTYLTSGTFQYDVMRADTNWENVTPSITGGLLGATKLAFSPASQNIPVNQNSALITVTLLQTNTAFNATANTVVALSSTSGGGTFLSGADGATVITNVTISSGTSTATFYYRDSVAGNPTITGDSGLLIPATQSETVTTAGAPPNFLPGSTTVLPSGNISLTATGALGSTYKLWASTNVALTPIPSTWTLLSNGTVTVSPFTIYDLTATNFSQRFYLFSAP